MTAATRHTTADMPTVLLLLVLAPQAVPPALPAPREAGAPRTAVVEAPLLRLRATEGAGTTALVLPEAPEGREAIALIDGWLFWAHGAEPRPTSRWVSGEAERLRASHVLDGRQLEFELPALSAAEDSAWQLRFGADSSNFPYTLGYDASLVALPGRGFLLQDTDNGRRASLVLGFDGSVRELPRLERGPRYELLEATPGDDVGQSTFVGVHHRGVKRWTPTGAEVLVADPRRLAVDPGWPATTMRDGSLWSMIRPVPLADGVRLTLIVETTIHWQMKTLGSPGPYLGPTSFTLVRLDARAGAVLTQGIVPPNAPLASVLGGPRRTLFAAGDDIVALTAWPRAGAPEARGTWTFTRLRAVPDPSGGDGPAGWATESVDVTGPTAEVAPRLLGTLAPGTALYWIPSTSERPEAWVTVQGD